MSFIRIITLSILAFFSSNLYAQTSPGGVSSGLVLWMKADAGILGPLDNTTVSDWYDQSPTASHLIASNYPLYVQVCANYNPGIFYTALDNHFVSDATINVTNSSVFIAGTPLASSSWDSFRLPWASDGETAFPLAINNNELGHYIVTGSAPTGLSSGITWNDGETSFAREHIYSSNDVDISKQGGPTSTLSNVASGADAYYYLGGDPNVDAGTTAEGFGKINETIIYDHATMDATDIKKIESYLGLKYGVTLDNSAGTDAGDYLLSNGNTIWNADEQANYHKDVIGLVRDDASGLLQKQAHSSDDKIRVFLDALAVDNVSNNGVITNDLSSLIIGNNGGLLHDDGVIVKPSGIYHMIARTWKITNTNFKDNFSIEVKWDSTGPFDLNDIRFLVSPSPDFSAATIYDGNSVNFSIGSIIVGGISNSIIPMGATMYVGLGSASASTTLPIVIKDFNARAINNSKVSLTWQTTAEHNNSYFKILRSADGNQWEFVAKVNSLGDANDIQNYSAMDENPLPGISYYLLQQVDIAGHSQYTTPRSIKIDKTTPNIVLLYPNPVIKQLNIKGSADELETFRVFAMNGMDVTNRLKLISRSSTNITLDMSSLEAGTYQIKTSSKSYKIIKLNH